MGKDNSIKLCPLMLAHLVGIGVLQLAVVLLFVSVFWAVTVLVLFVALCLAAPFFPRMRFYGPILTRGSRTAGTAIALTFDDGPHPTTTPKLLELLAEYDVKATFFVVGKRVSNYSEGIEQILAQGHTVANHSWSHDPVLMLRTRKTLNKEIVGTQEVLKPFGIQPLAFRPPAGIVNPRLWGVLLELGMVLIGFNRRALDFGNRRIYGMADRLLEKIRPGDILLLHDGAVGSEISAEDWLQEVKQVLEGLKAREIEVRSLANLLKRPIMEQAEDSPAPNAIRAFYDGLAVQYDEEQESRFAAPVRNAEKKIIEELLPDLVQPSHTVLEIGAGTGRFTLELAKRAQKVVANDLSQRMLVQLAHKAQAANVTNIKIRPGSIQKIEMGGPYDLICSFSAFEYVSDLPALLGHIANNLAPGGSLFFTTSHRCLFRVFTQIGNAMRQGLWLYARSQKQIEQMLIAAGLTPVHITTHALKNPLNPGMLLSVVANKG
ncbi:MAG: polysaccharide deacetylase family protein [Pseudomonadota bacterium]